MIDYFSQPKSEEAAVLRRIKGNFRRMFVTEAIAADGLDSVPDIWKSHELPEMFKGMMQAQAPNARGGEDLPDLSEDEVEIARMTLKNSVHGEVTSLRARPVSESGQIKFRIVDEYGTEFDLPSDSAKLPLSADEVAIMFRDSDPSPTETECEIGFQSYFYPNLNEIALGLIG